ncbi:MAG: phosphate acetyltransferase [Paracoccaceae bacterium]
MTLSPTQMAKQIARDKRAVIAMSEGTDPRIVEGSLAALRAGIADIILVGASADVERALQTAGRTNADAISIHDPADSPLSGALADEFFALRSKKGVDMDAARKAVQDPLVYAALLVRLGHADGTVGGAVATTGDVVRAAIQMIGKAPDAALVSSFFLMYPPEPAPTGARAMLYSDCGLVIDPSAQELASIAEISAASFKALMKDTPRIAMLSFSTKGSARHDAVTKVTDATTALQTARPDLTVDGELQFDAAFVPAIGQVKSPGSDVAGQANVMIFPNLDAGNIGYKMTQRLGGYTAIGPVMQGLNKPANDLSRGCVAADVREMIAVTVLQATPE